MSFDAITSIAQAEDAAKVAVQYARAQAKQMLADADAAGKASVAAAVDRAEKELVALGQKADEKSVADAKQVRAELDKKKAALRAEAGAKLEAAATLVAERIVNGWDGYFTDEKADAGCYPQPEGSPSEGSDPARMRGGIGD